LSAAGLPSGSANSAIQLRLTNGLLQGYVRDTDLGGPPEPPEVAGGQVLIGSQLLADGQFHFVALQRDQGAGRLRLFVDGAEATNAILNAGASAPSRTTTAKPIF
jgi:hypothetical protein